MEVLIFHGIFLSGLGSNQSLLISLGVVFFSFLFLLGKESIFFQLDIFSWSLVMLTVLIFILIFLSTKGESFLFYVLYLFLFLTFMTKNMFLFFVFFEWTVFPTFFLILGLGYSSGRMQASFFFLFYTMFFSLPFLFFVLTLFFYEGSLSMFSSFYFNFSVFWGLLILMVFSSKLPVYYLHLWLPKAHVEAPLGGSMVLAAILLKLGSYGIIRIIKLFFWVIKPFSIGGFCVGIMGAILSGVSCYSQVDLKRLVAFMSVSHMGVMFSGLLSFSWSGVIGGTMFMVSHGLVSSGLFFLVNLFYQRLFSRSLFKLKSGGSFMSFVTLFSFLLLVSNLALPPTLSFISEVHLIWAMLSFSLLNSFFIFLLIIISSMYTVHFFLSAFHGNDFLMGVGYSGYVQEVLSLFSHFSPLLLILVLFL
uniref:NADH dehydrogenase subunit 4 n=1 Tax=Pentidionis agamae TaxID=3091002 RepID=UPI003000FD38|nr:NADH dehydrogenase subunit 4 [Pentidionis agamae]